MLILDFLSQQAGKTHIKNTFFWGRTTKVWAHPRPQTLVVHIFLSIFFFDEKKVFISLVVGGGGLSGPTTKKKLSFYVCLPSGKIKKRLFQWTIHLFSIFSILIKIKHKRKKTITIVFVLFSSDAYVYLNCFHKSFLLSIFSFETFKVIMDLLQAQRDNLL